MSRNGMKRFIDRLWQARAQRLAPCPMPQTLPLLQGGRVLVVAPHPDDETLGCGGTLALLRRAACTVRVMVVTDGAAGDPLRYVDDVVATRQAECRAALRRLDIDEVVFLAEPDGGCSVHAGLRRTLAQAFADFRPDWVFGPAPLDYHRDHVAVSLALAEAWHRHGGSSRLFYYEIWSPLPVTHVVDIGTVMELKRAATGDYALPLRYGNYLGAIEGLSAYRGLFLPQGAGAPASYAEGFLEESRTSPARPMLMRLRTWVEQALIRTAPRD